MDLNYHFGHSLLKDDRLIFVLVRSQICLCANEHDGKTGIAIFPLLAAQASRCNLGYILRKIN